MRGKIVLSIIGIGALIIILGIFVFYRGSVEPPVTNQNQQVNTETSAVVVPDEQSNVTATNQMFTTPGQTVTVKGIAIFTTTSCFFKTPEHNPPPGFESPCARDSGYIILSDKPYQQSRKLDPTEKITTLNNTEVLVFYVPDEIVAGVQLGDFYELSGETTTYNSQPGIRYQQ